MHFQNFDRAGSGQQPAERVATEKSQCRLWSLETENKNRDQDDIIIVDVAYNSVWRNAVKGHTLATHTVADARCITNDETFWIRRGTVHMSLPSTACAADGGCCCAVSGCVAPTT
jgi:hypothetical protein